jgi:hypothetical protein
MKIGKLEFKSGGWFWGNKQLLNPIRILWNLAILPFYILILFIFCSITLALTLDFTDFRDTWEEYFPF